MTDDSSNQKPPVDIPSGGISRRQLLGLGGVGLAGTLLSPPISRSAAAAPGAQRRPDRLLLKDGIVLTLDRAIGDFPQADVLIEDGKIKAVAPRIRLRGTEVIDASGMIVMPGFVDTHRHMWQGLLRNIGPDDLLGDYLAKILFGFAPILTPDEVFLGCRLTQGDQRIAARPPKQRSTVQRRHLHSLLQPHRQRVAEDRRHWRKSLPRRADRNADGARDPAHSESARLRNPPEPEHPRRDKPAHRHVHPDACVLRAATHVHQPAQTCLEGRSPIGPNS
jgi:hypothetical protein